VFIAVAVGWWLLGRLLFRHVLLPHLDKRLPVAWSIVASLLLLGGLFLGMRGKISKIPIRVSTAYFCNNPFLNQIGLNPVFTFMKSVEDAGKRANDEVELIDDLTAYGILTEWQNQPADSTLKAIRLPEGMNVVLVLMESMSRDKTGLYDAANSLTPCLDSLMRRSMTFSEAWSAGIHTHNGIYSTLYGHPAIMARQMIKNTPIPNMCGLPQRLRDAGYHTYYFMTHDELYDNMQGFLYGNGFERVIGEHSYPKNEVIGTWGVPDHVMFDHVLEHIDSIAAKGPFLATVMTCSDHGPYIVPDGIDFKAKHDDDKLKRIVEYADWAIGRFVRMAEKKAWFENTLFVFVADHGAFIEPEYEMALNYNHVPLLFFAPRMVEPGRVDRLAMQIDIAPTILAMLGLDPGSTMLGTDLTTHRRKYAYFSADDKIGVVDGELFYLYRVKTQQESLYRYKEKSTDDLIEQEPRRAEAMRRHAFGMTQSSQQMFLDGSTACDNR
jgi:phosphoglycerol transferase MdoB-like AlkP superfamily enzyme